MSFFFLFSYLYPGFLAQQLPQQGKEIVLHRKKAMLRVIENLDLSFQLVLGSTAVLLLACFVIIIFSTFIKVQVLHL